MRNKNKKEEKSRRETKRRRKKLNERFLFGRRDKWIVTKDKKEKGQVNLKKLR